MKAIEIATRNHVTVDDVNNICQELNIPCAGEDSEIEGNDIFLVEKRIEIIRSFVPRKPGRSSRRMRKRRMGKARR